MSGDPEQDCPDEVMSDDEWGIIEHLSHSDGFDVDPVNGSYNGGYICVLDLDRNPVILNQYINLAIEEYCKKNDGKKLKRAEPVKWNLKVVFPLEYYITFTAEDEETGEVDTYQALVVCTIPEEDTYVEMVRMKPKKRLQDDSPSEGSSSKKLCH